jgi:tetratricopeptide (TPR) repeat protein
MKRIIIVLCTLYFVSCNRQEQRKDIDTYQDTNTSQNENIELKDKSLRDDYGYTLFAFATGGGSPENEQKSLEYYQKALESYNENDFTNAIGLVEAALNINVYAVYYYLYGICLMDIHDYKNAEKAFEKYFQFSERELGNQESYGWSEPYIKLYTFDDNKNVRERYFAHYNLACIYSITKNFEQSIKSLLEALKWGYPYINHILNDSDLYNLYIFDSAIKEKINDTYLTGFIDSMSEKNYKVRILNDASAYLFGDNKTVRLLILSSDDRCRVFHGIYEVKNYQILIQYNKVTGYKGLNGFSLGGTMVYEDYEPYENEISTFERIAIKNITAENKWEEKDLDAFNYFFETPGRRSDFYEIKEKYNR